MTAEDFDFVSSLLRDRSGLILSRDKSYLIENRLMPLIRRRRINGLDELIRYLRQGEDSLTGEVVDAMMTSETSFFRDWSPFEHFRTVTLPNLVQARKDKETFRILCCGVSTGQEAYSLALMFRQEAKILASCDPQIIGLDLSQTSISRAEKGLYSQFEAQSGLPINMLLSGFDKVGEFQWRIKDILRSGVEFKTWNLLDELYPLGAFDVVFCRNVLMFFDQETKAKVLGRVSRLLGDDGVLYMGLNETTAGVSESFKAIVSDLGVFGIHRTDRPKVRSLAESKLQSLPI
ncbi:MAG: protein-glutamate O-methyltransferase CheR [Rhodospirillaceae bacterium]